MGSSVPYDVSAGFSALLYDISGQPALQGKTLAEILGKGSPYKFSHKEELYAVMQQNGLENVTIVDTSWSHKSEYGTMNAATFQFPNGDTYVAYRGTGDGNWVYNADSAYGQGPSDMQKWALAYFDDTIERNYNNQGQLYVTGHSQGGNNAMFVTLFSEYGSLITNCISNDGPGFSSSVIEEAKRLWGEAYYELQREKSYAVYGENDYVHGLGEVQMTPPENTFFVSTPEAADIGGYHDIFTHITNGKLNPECEEGEVSKLTTKLVGYLGDLPPDQRYEAALIVMKLIENHLNGGEEIFEHISKEEYLYLVNLLPVIWETLLHNPENILAVLQELGVDKMLEKYLKENPAIIVGLILLSPVLILLAESMIVLAYLIDALIHIVEGIIGLAKAVKDFVINCLQAIKNALGKLASFLRSISPGGRYANANPYFKVDTDKLRAYATRINNVNNRLKALDGDLNGLYWQVGLLDIWDILMANMLTSGSPTLNKIKSYLNNAAADFKAAEDKARGYMGG